MYQVKVDSLYIKLPKLLRMNLHHLIMMTSQRHHMKTCDGNHGALERKFTGFFLVVVLHARRQSHEIHQEL